jgi:tetratricopeptide (TPR) repeat protein
MDHMDDKQTQQRSSRDAAPKPEGQSGDRPLYAESNHDPPQPGTQARRKLGFPAWMLGLLILALTGVLVWAGDAYIRSRQNRPSAVAETRASPATATPAGPKGTPTQSPTSASPPATRKPAVTPPEVALPPTPPGTKEAFILVADLGMGDQGDTVGQERADALSQALWSQGREIAVERLGEALDESNVHTAGQEQNADFVIWSPGDASDTAVYLRRTGGLGTDLHAIRALSPVERKLALVEPVETEICLPAANARDYARAAAYVLGVAAYHRGDTENAQTLFGEALNSVEQEAQCGILVAHAHHYLGNLAALDGEYETALDEYEAGLGAAAEPGDQALLHTNRAAVHLAREQDQAALAAAEQALRLDPEQASAYYQRASAYRAIEQPENALLDLNRALELDPRHARAYAGRGLVLHNNGDFEAALDDYERALELDPWAAEVYLNRGGTYATLGNLDAALADYGLALALKPDDADIHYNRGTVYAMQERYPEAIRDLDRALELNPDFAQVYGNRGLVYKAMGETEKAIADLELFLELTANPRWRAMIEPHLEELKKE